MLVDAVFGGCVQFEQVLLHELEDHPGLLVASYHLLHFYDVRVGQPRSDLQLTGNQLVEVGRGVRHLLYRHELVAEEVAGFEHLAEVAASSLGEDLVLLHLNYKRQ